VPNRYSLNPETSEREERGNGRSRLEVDCVLPGVLPGRGKEREKNGPKKGGAGDQSLKRGAELQEGKKGEGEKRGQ